MGMDILLVEDDPSLAGVLSDSLADAGHRVKVFRDGGAALVWMEGNRCSLVVTDVRLPGADGLKILQAARSLDPPAEVLIMTGYATIEQAVEAMGAGAWSYLQKPFPGKTLLAQVEKIASVVRIREEVEELRRSSSSSSEALTGSSPRVRDLNEKTREAALGRAPILLEGENGTGKERVARFIHSSGGPPGAPFVPVSLAAIPEGLLQGELFGHKKGAFTGADEDRVGLMEQAGEGTLFLDDIDDASLSSQACLLRVLQENEFTPLGSEKPVPFGARVVSASKVALKDAVEGGSFREDLYYRLAVVPLVLPPLRKRMEDLGVLLGEFLRAMDPENRYRIPSSTLSRLRDHEWPGNTRELRNSLVRALALSGRARLLKPGHFFPSGTVAGSDCRTLSESVSRAEKKAIQAALTETEGRKQAAAEILGISRKVLWKKCKDMGLAGDLD